MCVSYYRANSYPIKFGASKNTLVLHSTLGLDYYVSPRKIITYAIQRFALRSVLFRHVRKSVNMEKNRFCSRTCKTFPDEARMAWTRPTSCIFLSHVLRSSSRHLPTQDLARRKGGNCRAKALLPEGPRVRYYSIIHTVLIVLYIPGMALQLIFTVRVQAICPRGSAIRSKTDNLLGKGFLAADAYRQHWQRNRGRNYRSASPNSDQQQWHNSMRVDVARKC